MSEYTIKNLQDVLHGKIKKHMKISGTKMKPLTSLGDNFGSTMLQLDVTLKNERDNTEEELHLVAKKLPELERTRKFYNIQVTFKNEIGIYDTIIPTLQNFQRENGVEQVIDCVPDFYGSRINLNEESDTVDEDAVLILENLKMKGYKSVDRYDGLDLETTQLILKDLAAFHATPIALKLKNPEVFEKKVKPYLSPFIYPTMLFIEERDAIFLEIFNDPNICFPGLQKKIQTIFDNEREAYNVPPREPFSTMTHGDLWTNNIMVKFQNGKPVANKLIDFQFLDYRSPATDLFFFLFANVQLSLLRDQFYSLIEFYHKHFISHLKALKCDVAQFSLTKFLEEMEAATDREIIHTSNMAIYMFPPKRNDLLHPEQSDATKNIKDTLNPISVEKIRFMVHTCGKMGWL